METFYTYLLKSSISLILFYAFYRLVVFKNTYFKIRRLTLLAILLFSVLYPLVDIADWLVSKEPVYEILSPYALSASDLVIEAPVQPESTPKLTLTQIGLYLYLGGVFLLTLRMFIQLASIVHLRHRLQRIQVKGYSVYRLTETETPFSFFSWIFINPDLYSSTEKEQILTHEATHCHQYHSVDVLVSEIITLFFWFNPFAWLFKQEVRVNLEHLADACVIEQGTEAATYQYSLLRLCHHVTSNKLVNNFNIPQFKRRIMMKWS